MARSGIGRLKLKDLKTTKPGMLADGGNLYLQVSKGISGNIRRSWILRFVMPGGRQRDLGLGGLDTVGLAQARELAKQARELLVNGVDPIDHRNEQRAKTAAAQPMLTFDQAAHQYIETHKSSWKNKSHRDQWPSSLRTYASPKIGKMLVSDIDTKDVMRVLTPIWHDKTDTATRVRQRIELVLGWAGAQGLRKDEHGHDRPNPARWQGHLKNLLAPPTKVRKRRNQPALAYSEMSGFLADLRARTGITPLALEFTILTGVRTKDVRGARRSDIDHDKRMWIIPVFSKTGLEHRVPLSKPAMAVVEKVEAICRNIGREAAKSEYLFPNDSTGKRLSENALLAVIERMGRKGTMTTHGCRATFRTWLQEQTSFPHELAEMSLGHKVGDETVRAYARGDALKKRFAVMEAWASYCAKPVAAKDGKIIPMRSVS